MIKRRNPSLFVLLCLLLLPIFLNINYNYNNSSLNNVEFPAKNEIVKSSGSYNEKVIVFFNRSSYNNSITSTFKYYGGIIKKEWNNLFSSISGFAGIISN